MKEISNEIRLFEHLLQQVASRFMEFHHPSSPNITEWKGQDILDFQEDLRQKVKGSVSEKWFYNYVKNKPGKLPRVDILNLLARYSGYSNWNSFKAGFSTDSKDGKMIGRKSVLQFGIPILGVFAVFLYVSFPKTKTLQFCFLDADKKEPITEIPIDVIILNEGESPSYMKTDSLGCFTWRTHEDDVRFIAQSPYHKNDTIYKSVSGDNTHEIRLRTDDYALMLHYYSGNHVKDWQRRREELGKLFADDAIIFELLPYQIGAELYTKTQFIDKLSKPTKALQKLEIVETQYSQGQIVKLKFKITK